MGAKRRNLDVADECILSDMRTYAYEIYVSNDTTFGAWRTVAVAVHNKSSSKIVSDMVYSPRYTVKTAGNTVKLVP